MKSALFLILLVSSAAAHAQSVFSNTTNTALQKVIEDYPNKFTNIKGDKIGSSQQAIDYHSKIVVPGAAASVITQYTNFSTEVYSWKSELFESGNFEESKERFKEIFNNIKNTIVKIDGLPPYIVNGKYEYPSEDKKNTTIAFQLLPASGELQKLAIDLSIRNTSAGWKISLRVYEKDLQSGAVAAMDK